MLDDGKLLPNSLGRGAGLESVTFAAGNQAKRIAGRLTLDSIFNGNGDEVGTDRRRRHLSVGTETVERTGWRNEMEGSKDGERTTGRTRIERWEARGAAQVEALPTGQNRDGREWIVVGGWA